MTERTLGCGCRIEDGYRITERNDNCATHGTVPLSTGSLRGWLYREDRT